MRNENYIISLDIGSTLVRVIVAKMIPDGTTHIVGVGTSRSKGMKKGAIINIDQAVHSIREAIEEAERMVGIDISDVYVGVSGNHVSLQPSHGVVAVSNEDKEIQFHDIDRVLQAARVIALPPERAIIEVVPKQFIVDGLEDIRDPHGMIGVRLEVDAMIVTGSKTIVHNLLRCVEKAGLNIAGMVFLPLAVSEYCLSYDERKLGIVLVDIGGGTTTVAVFQQGYLAGTTVIPIGGEYVTNDIAIGLRIKTEIAEDMKCKYGMASKEYISSNESFKVSTIGTNKEKTITQYDLSQIMEPRIEELFHLLRQQVEAMGFDEELPGGFVLTGGVMATQNILPVAQKFLGQSVRVAVPTHIGMKKPSYTGGVGMIHYLQKRGFVASSESRYANHPQKKRGPSTIERVKNWLNEFI